MTPKQPTLYTGGTFDVFHYGHMVFLKQCAKICPRVVVSLNTDDFILKYKGRAPILNFQERKNSILLSGLASQVIENIGGEDSKPAILSVNPDFICIGDDWCKKDYYAQMSITQEWLDDRNILLCYIPYYKPISTTIIKERIRSNQ
jgi:glycerol-3-phosphate cytidylyltransferase